jgi:malate dehydrogenase (oxaloacetate-decarboxylating)
MLTKEELLAKARKPAEDAMRLHPFYQGKNQIAPKVEIQLLMDEGFIPPAPEE